MKITCRWRLVVSTCLLVWSFSSLFITHRLLKSDQKKDSAVLEGAGHTTCNDNYSFNTGRKRQIVQGWYDFRGELMKVPDIDPQGSEGFSSDPTEFNMKVGVARHSADFQYLIYDQVI